MLRKILRRIDTEINYLFFRRYRYARTVRRHLLKHYDSESPKATNRKKIAVYMANGLRLHGGLADRLRGIVSLYGVCRDMGIDFRINFTSPFKLERYLRPNRYNWLLGEGELSFNSTTSHPFFTDTRGDTGQREIRFQDRLLRKYLSEPFMQAHVYTSFYCGEDRFAELFAELFQPAPEIAADLRDIKQYLGNRYISVSTRFLELLGDFKEPKTERKPLTEQAQTALIDECINQIEQIHHKHPESKILVTSDSLKFLDQATSRLPYTYTIPGNIAHIDAKNDSAADLDSANHKTFVDFFAIAEASESYLLVGPGMYSSNFSKRAAQSDSHPFHTIKFQLS